MVRHEKSLRTAAMSVVDSQSAASWVEAGRSLSGQPLYIQEGANQAPKCVRVSTTRNGTMMHVERAM